MTRNESGEVKAVQTAIAIVEVLHREETTTIENIADELELGTSTVHRHLVTLRERGYVVTDGGEHRLGMQFLTHGGVIRARTPCNELINRKVKQISHETDERAQFIVEEHGDRVYVYTHAGTNAVRTDATIGKRGSLHVSAAGKSILANLDDSRIERILEREPFDRITENTITDEEQLKAELAQIRERGYAFNDEESTDGLRAVGVPIHHEDGTVLGAISVSGPANRLTGEYFREELPDMLLGTVNEIELNLQYS